MAEYTYSIVIPHYNSADLLYRMLKSIPEREDIQVIVVDDKSKPDEVEKLKVLNHKNLEIYYQPENMGAGAARNVALENVRGKWLLFADSDDYFTDRAFDVFDSYKSSSYEYINFCVISQDTETGEYGVRKITSDQSVRKYLASPNAKTKNLFKFRNFALWNKMISMDIVNRYHLRCEDVKVNNDVKFILTLAYCAKNVKVIPDELYCCTYTPGSITYKKRSVEREFLFYVQAKKRNGFYQKLGLGFPFYRYDAIYLPYIIKKRGLLSAFEFYMYCWQHRIELKSAENDYLDIFDYDK